MNNLQHVFRGFTCGIYTAGLTFLSLSPSKRFQDLPLWLLTADKTAELMLSRLVAAIKAKAGDRIMLLINGSGATTLMEMYIVLRGCKKYLDAKGISIAAARCGELLTVQEMAGFQMFAAKLDDEMLACWNAPCKTPALTVA